MGKNSETYAHYPFSYHEGMKIVTHMPKNRVAADIKRLFAEHSMTEEDTRILTMLCNYGYLNAFLIWVLLEQGMASCTRGFAAKRLAFLESRGLVRRFQLKYPDHEGKEHATPFIYEAAYKTKRLFQKRASADPEEKADAVLRRMSFNQFHIFMEKQMVAEAYGTHGGRRACMFGSHCHLRE